MHRSTVVVVTGPPAGGKTTLARLLAPELGLPLISKDDLKVILYQTLGWGGRQRDRDTSTAAYELMLNILGAHLQAGTSLMIESNFRPEIAFRLAQLLAGYGARTVQVRCFAGREVLIERIKHRAASELRHPGHADKETVEDLEDLLASGVRLDLRGAYLEVDSTDPRQIDREMLVARLREELGGGK